MESNTVDRPHGMMTSELKILAELVQTSRAKAVLEIGMAFGSSTLAILEALKALPDAHLTSVDPFQMHPTAPDGGVGEGYGGVGLRNVQQAGFDNRHTWIGLPDYLALPKLAQEGRRFDFIFIDGYHSFDYAMLDFFFSDLLLVPGGMVVFHDSGSLPVYRVCQFVNANKAYTPVGPPLALILSSRPKRIARRAFWLASGQDGKYRERRQRWKSLAAFVKQSDGMAEQFVLKGI
jgi:Methyltransferase domain